MERPSKRMRIEDPDNRSPRDSGSRMAEGLFTSELGTRSDDTDSHRVVSSPTPTVSLTEFQQKAIFGRQNPPAPLQRRAEATVTVAASEVVVNVNDGSSTIAATTIAPVDNETVLSLENLGAVTISANLTESATAGLPNTDASSITSLSLDSETITSTPSPAGSVLSEALNSTLTDTITADITVTVTTTATLEVSFLNGTLFPAVLATATASDASSSRSGRITSTSDSSEASGIVMTDDSSSATVFASNVDASGGVAASATSEAPAATSSESGAGGGGGTGPALTPQQQSVVGGVVGGVAGVALILVLILFLLRRYRAKLKAQGRLPEQIAEREAMSDGGGGYGMSQRSSAIPLTATLASSLRKFRPMSSHTAGTDGTASTAPEGERGFQRIAGRKIAPVLSSGGDGYGGDYGAFAKEAATRPSAHRGNDHSLAGSSFYRDGHGFYGGRGTDSPTYPPSPTIGTAGTDDMGGPSTTRDFAGQGPRTSSQYSLASNRPEVTVRPSPARTPVTVSPSPSSIRLPIQQTPTMSDAPPVPPLVPGLQVPDGVGRSLPHQDGSRVSARSRGSARSRFAENV